MLAVGQNDARQRDAILILHGVADYREGFQPALRRARCNRGVNVALSISSFGTKLSMSMVWLLSIWTASSSSFSISTYSPFFNFVTAPLLIAFDHVAGLGIDHLLLQPIAGSLLIMWKWVLSADVEADKAAPGTTRGNF